MTSLRWVILFTSTLRKIQWSWIMHGSEYGVCFNAYQHRLGAKCALGPRQFQPLKARPLPLLSRPGHLPLPVRSHYFSIVCHGLWLYVDVLSVIAPQVKLGANGQLIVDQSSLVQQPIDEPLEEFVALCDIRFRIRSVNWCLGREHWLAMLVGPRSRTLADAPRQSNGLKMACRILSSPATSLIFIHLDTNLFFQCLSWCGTDFDTISRFFTDRDQHQIKVGWWPIINLCSSSIVIASWNIIAKTKLTKLAWIMQYRTGLCVWNGRNYWWVKCSFLRETVDLSMLKKWWSSKL